MKYYVYIYVHPITLETFYVGKGMGGRMYRHLGRKDKHPFTHKLDQLKQHGHDPIIIKVKDNLTESDAFKYEIKLIEILGRKWLGKGTLCNLTDGGEGSSGYGKPHSKEHCKAISEGLTGKKLSKAHRDKIVKNLIPAKRGDLNNGTHWGLGSTHTPEECGNIQKRMKGNSNGRKKWEIIYPNGTKEVISSLPKFCEENDLDYNAMIKSDYFNRPYKGHTAVKQVSQ